MTDQQTSTDVVTLDVRTITPRERHPLIFKSVDDLKDLLAEGDSDSVERIVSELHLNDMPQRVAW